MRSKLTEPDPLPTAYATSIPAIRRRRVSCLRMGDPHNRLDPVDPSVPRVIKAGLRNSRNHPTGRRTALAEWLADPE